MSLLCGMFMSGASIVSYGLYLGCDGDLIELGTVWVSAALEHMSKLKYTYTSWKGYRHIPLVF